MSASTTNICVRKLVYVYVCVSVRELREKQAAIAVGIHIGLLYDHGSQFWLIDLLQHIHI